jgi:hypothetical protein
MKEVFDRGVFIDLLQDLCGELSDRHFDGFDASARSNILSSWMTRSVNISIFHLERVTQDPSLRQRMVESLIAQRSRKQSDFSHSNLMRDREFPRNEAP